MWSNSTAPSTKMSENMMRRRTWLLSTVARKKRCKWLIENAEMMDDRNNDRAPGTSNGLRKWLFKSIPYIGTNASQLPIRGKELFEARVDKIVDLLSTFLCWHEKYNQSKQCPLFRAPDSSTILSWCEKIIKQQQGPVSTHKHQPSFM